MADDFEERAIFLAALDLSGQDRAAFLDGACPEPVRRVRITALLESHKAGFPQRNPPAVDAAGSDAPGVRIGSFRILKEIGRGGMGVVYLAEDTQLERPVALKVLGTELLASPEAVASLHREAKLAAALEHPGVVQVYQFGLADGRGFIASAYVNGPTLKRVIDEERARRASAGSSSPRAWIEFCVDTIATVAETLSYCHQKSVIHRDVKPSNILMDPDGGPRLTDFGIAVTDGTVRGHTAHDGAPGAHPDGAGSAATVPLGTLEGSCHYMSPEQASLKQVRIDARSDVFSLGVVLYEMLALRRPFDGSTTDRILRSVRESTELGLSSVVRGISPDLVTVCHKCLEKDPADRYQSAAHVAADLRSWRAGEPILARPRSLPSRAARWLHRRRRGVAWSALFLVTLFSARALMVWQKHQGMGRIVIPEEMVGYRVDADRLDATTGGGASRFRVFENKVAPFSVWLEPGLYRVVFTRDGEARREAISLLTPGYVDRVVVQRPRDDDRRSFITVQGAHTPHAASSGQAGPGTPAAPGGFRIAATEVSNREYREYVLETGAGASPLWVTPYSVTMDDLPVAGISWDDANAYTRWRGVRLPTAGEWEAAASNPDGRKFPWGDGVRTDLVRETSREVGAYVRLARPVASDPHLRSPLGLYHLASNVADFVASIDPAHNNGLVLKGRSFRDDASLSSSDRVTLSGRHLWAPNVGFRVVLQE
jgi:serine/threonine protein kinase